MSRKQCGMNDRDILTYWPISLLIYFHTDILIYWQKQFHISKISKMKESNGKKWVIRKVEDLRYYATFKVRKFESLLYKIDTCLQNTTTCLRLWAEQIFSVNIYYIYFFNFGRGFCDSFFMMFPEAPASWDKEILK